MNWNLLGHEWAVDLLKEHVAQGSLRHAYLITGPQGVGRRTLAIRLAQALNCLQPGASAEPCGTCRPCRQIERMQHPDLTLIQAEEKGGTLKVEQVRELQRGLSLAPYEARYRVAILLHFEDANASASNALLKTLEEPPPQVVLILTAESPEALLPTIVSRCEVLRLRPLSLAQVCQGLQDCWGLPAEQADLLAHISAGRPGYALHLSQAPELLEQRITWLDRHFELLGQNRVNRFAFVDTVYKDKEMLRRLLPVWVSLWRDVLLRAAGAAAPLTNPDQAPVIDALATQVGMERAHITLAAIERTLDLLDRNANARLALEVLMLDLPY